LAANLNANISPQPVKSRSRLFQGILPLNRASIANDILAGIVLAAVGIPEVMGYTKIAGTPIATGLYTLILPAVAFAILGSSRHLVAHHGITIVGKIPSGLPYFAIPAVTPSEIPQVFGVALSCWIVIIAQSAATARAYAFRYGEGFNENTDLDGLAAANLAAGLTGTFVVNGSPTKTEIVDTAGGRSQVAQLATVAIVLIVILFLTQPIGYLPNPVLAAIVFSIGLRLIDIKGMRSIFKSHREEFYLAIVTAVTVVFVGVKEGIILAIMLSLILHVRHSYRPHSAIVIPDENRLWQAIPVQMGSVSAPGLIIYRFSRDLFYANATFFSEEIESLVKSAQPSVRWFILEARAITGIDYSASLTIRDVAKELSSQNVTFMISGLPPQVKRQFDRDGLTNIIGADKFFNHLEEALEVFDLGS
jgi:sulfate permease, SulP family